MNDSEPKPPEQPTPIKKWFSDGVNLIAKAKTNPAGFLDDLRKEILTIKNGGIFILLILVAWIFYSCGKSRIEHSNQSPSAAVSKVTKSTIMQNVSMTVTNAIGSALIQGSGNSASVDNSKKFFETNSGQIQGQINAPDHISVVQNFYNENYSNAPDPELTKLRDRVAQVESKIETESTNIHLTQSDLLAFTALLKKIDERTADIERLPDGRTSLGGVVAIGSLQYAGADYISAVQSYNRGDYRLAFDQARKTVDDIESSQRNWQYEIVSVKPEWKAQVYYLAASCAQRIASNNIANEFALKSIQSDASPENKMLLVTTLANLGNQKFNEGNLTNSFEYLYSAVTNFESVATEATNNISREQIVALYGSAARSAFSIGNTNEGVQLANKAMSIFGQLTSKPK